MLLVPEQTSYGVGTLKSLIPDSGPFMVAYAGLLGILGFLIIRFPGLDITWTAMMIPVVLAALFYRWRAFLVMLAYYTAASIAVMSQGPNHFLYLQMTLVFIAAVGAVAETIFRLTRIRERDKAALRSSEERFRNLNDELETRVQQRTAQ